MDKHIHKMTTQITTGAMFIAIFAIILIINRQTGSMFEEMFLYILPIPMVAYSATFGWKPSVPVLIAMAFASFLFGTFTTIFYAVTEAFIGMVLGTCIYKKVDSTKTIFLVSALSGIVNVVNTVVLASLFGYDPDAEVAELQKIMNQLAEKYSASGITVSTELFTTEILMRIFIISMVLMGIIQGVIIYYLSFLILKRLKFKIEKPKSLYYVMPPKWTGYLVVAVYLVFTTSTLWTEQGSKAFELLETAYLCVYIYSILFGFLGVMLYFKARRSGKATGLIVAFLLCFTIPILLMLVGISYITGYWHQNKLDQLEGKAVEKAGSFRGWPSALSSGGVNDAAQGAASSADVPHSDRNNSSAGRKTASSGNGISRWATLNLADYEEPDNDVKPDSDVKTDNDAESDEGANPQ